MNDHSIGDGPVSGAGLAVNTDIDTAGAAPSTATAASDGDPARTPLADRFAVLADLDGADDERLIGAFRDVLGSLRNELDGIGR
ncbi:hypothetical protein [Bifidobacterium platyrrhinorum]|uniref:Uncharacterized protein n=1 Tax=Bifidobacterium platyrrhinorum TaxID=2661628 RepID=A0A6L9ST79_9BIFI|nr:hypothetical protein [Bifidobacterium platyrrhinorum]NEG55748.1 hypothetical protein [Bifidobacterium platyrrhinorum]